MSWYFITDDSRQPFGFAFKGQAVQAFFLGCLASEDVKGPETSVKNNSICAT